MYPADFRRVRNVVLGFAVVADVEDTEQAQLAAARGLGG